MDISLEKIELVKDRTGVSYREAKEALAAENGSVVDAIIRIEDEIDIAPKTAVENAASDMIDKIKEIIRKGNVSRILVKREDEVVLSLPMTLGVIGAVLIPEAAIFSAIVALGARCSVSVITKDGEEVDVVKKARDKFNDARDSYSTVAGGLMEKGSDALNRIREKADSVMTKAESEEDSEEPFDDDEDYFNFDDDYPDLEESDEPELPSGDRQDPVDEPADTAEEAVSEIKEETAPAESEEETSEQTDTSGKPAEEEDTEGKFESAINAFKAKRRFFK